MKALIKDGFAINVVPSDKLADSFHPDVAVRFVDVPDQVRDGWRLVDEVWTAPEAVEPVAPPLPAGAYVVDVPTFKMRFTPAQLLAVRQSTNETVKAFLSEILDDPRTLNVNLALPFVQGAIAFLAQQNLIGEDDVAAILAPNP